MSPGPRNALSGALLLLLLAGSGVHAKEVNLNSVTCSLDEYQDLFRRSEIRDFQQRLEQERLELQKEREALEAKLQEARSTKRQEEHQRLERRKVLPQNWQLLKHSAEGQSILGYRAERSLASYNFTLEFRVLEDEWTAIRLIDAQTIVTDWSILRRPASNPDAPFEAVSLGMETFMTLKDREVTENSETWQDHTLITNVSGVYRITFQAHAQVRTNRHLHTLQLNLLYPITETRLRLLHEGAAHMKELSVEPHAHWQTSQGENYTDVHLQLPSTQTLTVKWRAERGVEVPTAAETPGASAPPGGAAEADEGQVQATVVHDSLHSVDESVLHSLHSFKYLLDSEQSLNKIEIHFPGQARISSVVAHGMTNWKTVPLGNASKVEGSAVQVSFKSSAISKEVVVLVTTELDFDVSQEQVAVPTAVCQHVLRQSGTFGIVKLANVEVHQKSAVGAARMGVEQVPAHLSSKAGRPIVLAYKFLAPAHEVLLSVIHHRELPTLEALADAALYKTLVVDNQVMHSLVLTLQNTQRQYMEIQGVPEAATIWTTRVNSVSAKPVRGRSGSLLLPLMVGNAAAAALQAKTSVEVSWLSSIPPLAANGTLRLDPPRVDVPIAALSVEVSFPDRYEVNFTGSLKQVETFTQKQPTVVNHETGDEVVPKEFDFASMPPPSKAQPKNMGVKSKMPRSGQRWRFEQLLVVDGNAALELAYKTPQKDQDDGSWSAYIPNFWNTL
mmetsp:Transcript_96972/g.230643  ORF Transcript_96972/g.230643 Transcript_96972/m.230643 type:complete len:729 (-) Transcript_96972:102-2288(-)|eukprot:CAMPEP_0181429536 /NCGR_PEP_ID=MMETSP1110-20121109/17253_1 /TAXON_ID=174948 /ORGANISM="Symbiodinium sp., Strain CCMP421" /LENGTH=728 /DNA_ID=CAMNT_0023552813 /DNA_START=66 /DNA_END=2252 /DNA_ORIENTATION=+